MTEKLSDCEKCDTENSLKRVPSHFITLTKDFTHFKSEPGELVNSFIEEAAQDLKGHKDTIKNKDYKKE